MYDMKWNKVIYTLGWNYISRVRKPWIILHSNEISLKVKSTSATSFPFLLSPLTLEIINLWARDMLISFRGWKAHYPNSAHFPPNYQSLLGQLSPPCLNLKWFIINRNFWRSYTKQLTLVDVGVLIIFWMFLGFLTRWRWSWVGSWIATAETGHDLVRSGRRGWRQTSSSDSIRYSFISPKLHHEGRMASGWRRSC